jgi:hypothetical protein
VTIVFAIWLGIPNSNFKKTLFPFDHQNDWWPFSFQLNL